MAIGPEEYGRFPNRRDAELDASRRQELGAANIKIVEVWLDPAEHVVDIAECERCGKRMPRFDGRVVYSPLSIICGPCSVEKYGVWDEEPTLVSSCPVTDEPVVPAGPEFWAFGDFRTYETTFAALGDGVLVEVQLISERGHHAHFSMDRHLAAVVAKELERQLTEATIEERKLSGSTYHDRFLNAAPPKLAQLALPGTDVFFTLDEAPTVEVTQESRGDRIILDIRSEEASLRITMQGGVAGALWRFLERAGRER